MREIFGEFLKRAKEGRITNLSSALRDEQSINRRTWVEGYFIVSMSKRFRVVTISGSLALLMSDKMGKGCMTVPTMYDTVLSVLLFSY